MEPHWFQIPIVQLNGADAAGAVLRGPAEGIGGPVADGIPERAASLDAAPESRRRRRLRNGLLRDADRFPGARDRARDLGLLRRRASNRGRRCRKLEVMRRWRRLLFRVADGQTSHPPQGRSQHGGRPRGLSSQPREISRPPERKARKLILKTTKAVSTRFLKGLEPRG